MKYIDKMTLSGSHVENTVFLDKSLEKIVVGKIVKIEKHPDADKLLICQVDVGSQTLQIVTGAHNLTVGDLVPVATDGATWTLSAQFDGDATETDAPTSLEVGW